MKQIANIFLVAGLIFGLSTPANADQLWESVQPYGDNYQSEEFDHDFENNLNNDLGQNLGNNLYGFDKKLLGSLLGAAIGGFIGSKIGKGKGKAAATAAGTLLGYILAEKILGSMDQNDHQYTNQALEYSKDNQPVTWKNPNTLTDYQVTPINTYKDNDQDCREYVTRATIEDRSEEMTGFACRTDDGGWQTTTTAF